jgi:hypothetical protein
MNLRIPRVSTVTLKLISKPSFHCPSLMDVKSCLVNRLDRRNRLQFHDHFVDEKIDAIGAVDLHSLVNDGERQLAEKRDVAHRQFARETFLVRRLE